VNEFRFSRDELIETSKLWNKRLQELARDLPAPWLSAIIR
jgi:hypothetical protein